MTWPFQYLLPKSLTVDLNVDKWWSQSARTLEMQHGSPKKKRRVWKLYLRLQMFGCFRYLCWISGGCIQNSAPSCFFCNEHITYGMKIHEPLLLVIGITCRFIPSCSSCSQRKWLKMASPDVARIGLALLIWWSLQKKSWQCTPTQQSFICSHHLHILPRIIYGRTDQNHQSYAPVEQPVTPPKTKMSPKKEPFHKESRFPTTIFLGDIY